MTDTAGRTPPVMPPGRELDAEIATRVLGYELSHGEDGTFLVIDGYTDIAAEYEVPHYSTSWDAMRLVVERMVAQGYGVEMSIGLNGPGAFCIVTPPDGVQPSDWSETKGETLPHAVSLAALAARKAVEATNA